MTKKSGRSLGALVNLAGSIRRSLSGAGMLAASLLCALLVTAPIAADESVTVRAVSWFTARDGYSSAAFVNVVIDGERRWTIKGDQGLDPGTYAATIDGDKVTIESVRDVKGREHRGVRYRVAAHSWMRPIR